MQRNDALPEDEIMMRKLIALLFAAVLAVTPALAESGRVLDERWLCSDIQGNVTWDTTVELRDNFGLYVNRDWILDAIIPSGEISAGTVEDSARLLRERKIDLMKDESLTGHDAELVHKLYKLFTDWDYRNALGVAPAMPFIEAIQAIDSIEALNAYLFNRNNYIRSFPLTVSIGADYLEPDICITHISTPSLMLKDSAEYIELTQAGSLYYEMNQRMGLFMFERFGMSGEEAERVIENAFAFEAMMAEHIKPMSTHYESDYFFSLLNYYTPDELQELAGSFPILDMIQSYVYKLGRRFQVTEPEYIAALADLYTEENVPVIRDWLLLMAAESMTDSLDRETSAQITAIINDVFGIDGEANEDDDALFMVKELLSVPMDNLYIQTYCTEKQRQDIVEIIDEVLDNYHAILEETDWLSEETRARAVEKLDAIRVNAVYPDELGDWSELEFAGCEDGGSMLAAIAAIDDYVLRFMSERIDTAVDKDKWDQFAMETSQVNAFYNPQNNSINIMAGILCGDIYSEDMSREQIMGGIGTIIGHEISHAFDTSGAQFDKNGALNNWWTEADYAAFTERAKKLAAWYDGFIPVEGITYSGQQVQTEAIADMGGMKVMLAIAASQEGFDYDAFFRQFAKTWRCQKLRSSVIADIAEDTHPLRYLRVNATLAQFDEFVNLYDIQPGDGMYIAPEDRVAVW